MTRIGLDMQSAFGLPLPPYVDLAADIGCSHVTIGLASLPWDPCGFGSWSLKDDAGLQRMFRDRLRDRAVALSVVAGFTIRAGRDVRDLASDMDMAADFGASHVATVGSEPDIARAHDQFALLAAMAEERGLKVVLDFAAHHPISTLDAACAALRHAGSPAATLSLDAMHVFRSGVTVGEIAALDPTLIGYAQLCDVPAVAPHGDYAFEATYERLVPGEGDLPLADFVRALPADVLIGVEVPNRNAAEAESLEAFIGRAVAASLALTGDRSEATIA